MTKEQRICNHTWLFPHGVIDGRTNNETAIVRYCYECKLRQVSFTKKWQEAKGDYALDIHYKLDEAE